MFILTMRKRRHRFISRLEMFLLSKISNCPNLLHTSLDETAPAPSEPGDKLSTEEEAVSLLQMQKRKHTQHNVRGQVSLVICSLSVLELFEES